MNGRIGTAAIVAIAAAFLVSAVPAQAGWLMSHGSAAMVAYSGDWDNFLIYGTGFSGDVRGGKTTAVTIPLPAHIDPTLSLKKIKVAFFTANNVRIVEVAVWDGNSKIRTKTVNWTGAKTVISKLYFPKPYYVKNGLALTIKFTADNTGDRFIQLKSVGALLGP